MNPTQLARLRAKHRVPYAVPFPDLSHSLDPCTCGFGPTPRRGSFNTSAGLIVSHLHKSSYQVLLRSEVEVAGRKV